MVVVNLYVLEKRATLALDFRLNKNFGRILDMISIFISLIGGVAFGLAYMYGLDGTWGSYIFGLIGTLVTFFIINKKVQKPLNELIMKVQTRLQKAGEEVQKKVNHFQSRPGGNQAAFMKTVDKIQKDAAEEALTYLEGADKYYKWNFLIEKQIDTMRFQLNYQIKNFEQVDKYLDSVWMFDPSVVTMKMARLYKKNSLKNSEDLEKGALKNWPVTKVFRKGVGRLKGDKSAMVYSTYAWMLIKSGFQEEALSVLTEASKKSADEVILKNIERLRNDKPKSFSNAKYGEAWYALFLEEPPKQKQKVVRQSARNAGRPF